MHSLPATWRLRRHSVCRAHAAYLIGPFLVASALDKAGFEQVIKDARARAKEG